MIYLRFLLLPALFWAVSTSQMSAQEVEGAEEVKSEPEEELADDLTPVRKATAEPSRSEATPEKSEARPSGQAVVKGPVQEMMTPEQFKAAGLNKLTPAELNKLNEFLLGFRQETLAKAETQAKIEKQDLIISRVDGAFEGLKGKTLIRLANGTVWKQANSSDRYKGPGRPGEYVNLAAVVMKKGLFGYKMRIEGTPEFYVTKVQ